MMGLTTLKRRGRRFVRGVLYTMTALLRAADDALSQNAGEEKREFFYGGQAVMEGVMMRGQYNAAISVRHPSGSIVAKEVPLNAALYRGRIAKMPFVRGLILLWDALGLGTSALMWSADVALEEEEDIDFSLEGAAGVGLVLVSLTFGIGLFFVLPAAISEAALRLTGLDSKLLADILEGVVKLGLLIGYIWAIAFMDDVKRLYGYHGAEHKTINAYEDGAELVPDVVKTYPIEHPRCGTAFLLTLVVLTVVIHMFTPRPDSILFLFLIRIGLIFPIAGIAYEVIRFTAQNLDKKWVQLMIKPNLALQHLTTREPDKSMVEVGIWSLKRVLAAEKSGVAITESTVTEVVPAPETGVADPVPEPSGD
ncbi:MAG: DUF1385 domain-containing protein [Anaerolineae bacterium]|nr:DUF1385 domain-containing protein [Anaerolineae bacterium]